MSTKKNNQSKNIGPIYQPSRHRIDKSSIKTTTLLSFVVFGIFLILILWGLTYFFINTYYSSMRSRETMNLAGNIESQYTRNPEHFEEFAIQTAGNNGVYIRLDTFAGDKLVFDGTSIPESEKDFNADIKRISEELIRTPAPSVSEVFKGGTSDKNTRLVYASQIETWQGPCNVYLISPLYPDHATINIIRSMLVYISMIVLLIATFLAFLLSYRLTRPIDNITKSAQDLSLGNFNVKFNGENFTETKELAKALNKASYEMEQTDFYQREIMANVSHDLKTPLTMIRGYAEKIIDITGDNPEKRNSDLNVIISETERLNGLVTDMMTVSSLQSNKLELKKETFDLVAAAQEVYESFQVLDSLEGFTINFQAIKPTYITGDKNKIMQVMTNFVSNAVKYSGENKFVDIQIKRVGRKVAFHCIDHGVGIASDELQHVWDRYYRTSANHEREIEGSGLGLSIVKGILTLHNASYGVNSELGKGSDFWFEMETVRKPVVKNGKEK